jgi:translation elongation factor EF-G
MSKLTELQEEDPQLHITYDERHDEIYVRLMGEIQTEILRSLVNERFGLDVTVDSGRILYRETVAEAVEGVGHFEPLKHYAEVHVVISPLEQGSGIIFESVVSEDRLDRNWQNLILGSLQSKTHIGVLTGSPITDVKITLTAGKAHVKHTEGGDFRQAAWRAVRQGLMKAESVLLEPFYSFTLTVPSEYAGRSLNDIQLSRRRLTARLPFRAKHPFQKCVGTVRT